MKGHLLRAASILCFVRRALRSFRALVLGCKSNAPHLAHDGAVSLELLNPLLWPIPPRQLGEIGLTALRLALGLAQPAR